MPRRRTRLASFALLALFALAPAASNAAVKAWDAAGVAKLTSDLAKACDALYDEFYAEQGMNAKLGSGDERDRYRVKHKLQRLEEETMHLAAEVAKGKGMAETSPSVEEIGVLARDLRELLARMYVMSPLQQRVDAARALWRELLPYYGIEPPADAPPKAS
jgi:hypothetical protein